MIIKREDEIIGTLIQKDPKAEKIYRKACYYKVDEEFGREVYNYNLEIRACDIDLGSGLNDPRIIWDGFMKLHLENPYDNGL